MPCELPPAGPNVAICIPVYNDWASIMLLIPRIDIAARSLGGNVDVLLIEDGAALPESEVPRPWPSAVRTISILRLRRNLGHQRAIAIGLTHLHVQDAYDIVVVMDGDGEDQPEDIAALVARCRELGGSHVVFAARTRRSESLGFRLGYRTYKLVHRALVGRRVEVGNFSAVPRQALARIVAVSELWNHYAAAVLHARIPAENVPIARGTRIAGRSTMNFVGLIMHGLSAIAVYSDIVGVRMLALITGFIVAALLGIVIVACVRFYTDLAIPGWATTAAGMLLVGSLNLVVLATILTLFTLRSRMDNSFLPLRDYSYFVLEHRVWLPPTP
jgi:hypothetical protein